MQNLNLRAPWTFAVVTLAAVSIFGQGVSAQEPGTALAGDAVERRLAGIEAQLKQIVAAMAEASHYREIDVLMTRIELKQRSISPVESELRSARTNLKSSSEERTHLAIYLEEWRENVQGAPPGSDERDALTVELERGERQVEMLERRERELEQQVLMLENQLGTMRDDVLTLEELVDERLGLR